MIYTIDRETPVKNLKKVTKDELEAIADRARQEIVYTGSLSSGIYIFRIHTDGKAKTMKAQKIN